MANGNEKQGMDASGGKGQNSPLAGNGNLQWLVPRLMMFCLFAIVVAILVWELSSLLLLVLGAVLGAVVLRSISQKVAGLTGMSDRLAVVVSLLLVAALLSGGMLLLGAVVISEIIALFERLPAIISDLSQSWNLQQVAQWLEDQEMFSFGNASIISNVTGFSATVIGVLINVLLVVAGSVFFAIDPETYRNGILQLTPRHQRRHVGETLDALAMALRRWMRGQLVSMLCVGVVTTISLMIVGVPSAFALGAIAGALEFIPYVGPISAAVPAILIALGESPVMAIWVAGIYFAIQQAESVLLVPLIQQRAVRVPAGLMVFSIIAFAIIFGPLGMLFGAPLTVIALVIVKKLWIREELEEETVLPHEMSANPTGSRFSGTNSSANAL